MFDVLSRHVDRGQLVKVRDALPSELRDLWPEDFLGEAPSQQGAAPRAAAPQR